MQDAHLQPDRLLGIYYPIHPSYGIVLIRQAEVFTKLIGRGNNPGPKGRFRPVIDRRDEPDGCHSGAVARSVISANKSRYWYRILSYCIVQITAHGSETYMVLEQVCGEVPYASNNCNPARSFRRYFLQGRATSCVLVDCKKHEIVADMSMLLKIVILLLIAMITSSSRWALSVVQTVLKTQGKLGVRRQC
jgi:hypothetical protein